MPMCISVPVEGGGGYSPGPGGSERHPVPAEIHPGSKSTVFFFFNHRCVSRQEVKLSSPLFSQVFTSFCLMLLAADLDQRTVLKIRKVFGLYQFSTTDPSL